MIRPVIRSNYATDEEYQKAYKKMIENIEHHKFCNSPIEDNRTFEECIQALVEDLHKIHSENTQSDIIKKAIILVDNLVDLYNQLDICTTSLFYERQRLEDKLNKGNRPCRAINFY